MRNVLLIARRELAAYLTTPMGYVIAGAVLLADGLLFNWFVLGGEARPSTEVLEGFFRIASGTTMIASVPLSMRLLAEDRQSGALVLLQTSPVSELEVVLGKYLSAVVFLAVMTLLSCYMPVLVAVHGKVSVGHIVAGYAGLLLLGSAAIAIGLLGSALAKTQVVAAIGSALMLLTLVLAWMGARVSHPPLDRVFENLALHNKHFLPFEQGIVGMSHFVYYGSVIFFFVLASAKVLEARRWR
jgi:ABC-2 type transport system permease protein